MSKILPIMLALCLILSETYYAQNYAAMIDLGLPGTLNAYRLVIPSVHDTSDRIRVEKYVPHNQ